MMVAEYSRHILGFLVHDVDRIIRVDWDKVRPADGMLSGNQDMITAITELPDGRLVSLLDVEQILASAFGEDVVGNVDKVESGRDLCVFFADDSAVARKKIAEVLDKMGVKHMQANNGLEAWERLKGLADTAQNGGIKSARPDTGGAGGCGDAGDGRLRADAEHQVGQTVRQHSGGDAFVPVVGSEPGYGEARRGRLLCAQV